MLAFLEELLSSAELVVTAQETLEELQAFFRETSRPELVALVKAPGNADELAALAPFTKDYPIPLQGARYYLCRSKTCIKPVDSISELEPLFIQNG